jgi:hypothetical protein
MRNVTWVSAVALLALFIGGCGREDGIDPSSVNEAYGGLTTEDEAPLFGEPAVFEAMGSAVADRVVSDPITTDPAFVVEEQNAPRVHYLFLAWGRLKRTSIDGLPTAISPQDFSGTLSVTDGGIAVLRQLRMELPQGDGVMPRVDRKLVEWQSTTLGGVDGLLVKIVGPEDATVTLTIAGQTIARQLGELDLSHGIIDLPDSDDGIAWAAAATAVEGCAHGYLVGRWNRRLALGGVFRGRWISADGELHGHLRGLFGARRDGDHVFFGKWIGGEGDFHGLLAGRFGDGELQGHWLDRDLQLTGRIKGLYFEPRVLDPRVAGFFLGTWQEACPADPIQPSEEAVQ